MFLNVSCPLISVVSVCIISPFNENNVYSAPSTFNKSSSVFVFMTIAEANFRFSFTVVLNVIFSSKIISWSGPISYPSGASSSRRIYIESDGILLNIIWPLEFVMPEDAISPVSLFIK